MCDCIVVGLFILLTHDVHTSLALSSVIRHSSFPLCCAKHTYLDRNARTPSIVQRKLIFDIEWLNSLLLDCIVVGLFVLVFHNMLSTCIIFSDSSLEFSPTVCKHNNLGINIHTSLTAQHYSIFLTF